MLKKKLNKNVATIDEQTAEPVEKKRIKSDKAEEIASDGKTSALFDAPFWLRFYELERALNEELQQLQAPKAITHIYNPVEYAEELHCAYLRRFLDGPKRVLFVGMNPGANGMGQTGVPFGNIKTVRGVMKFQGEVKQPAKINVKRPVKGLQCTIEEPSGVRIWTLLERLAGGDLSTFARQCYLHNFCPLIFFSSDGKNITPSELKGEYKAQIRDICLRTLDRQIEIVQPEIVVGVGEYVYSCLKLSAHATRVKMLRLPHPSPRSLNNQNWPDKAAKILEEYDLLKYIRNE